MESTIEPAASGAPAAPTAAADRREFLAFKLGTEEYGIDILRVQEIRSYERPTRIANMPHFIRGVVNLRGVVVPIIDMRLKLKLERVSYDTFTIVIVLNLTNRVVGMVVDAVSDVVNLSSDELRQAPELESTMADDCILGIGAVDERMLILIDIERMMSRPDMGLAERTLH